MIKLNSSQNIWVDSIKFDNRDKLNIVKKNCQICACILILNTFFGNSISTSNYYFNSIYKNEKIISLFFLVMIYKVLIYSEPLFEINDTLN